MKLLIDRLAKVEVFFSVVAIFLMTIFVVGDVLLREIFNTGYPWLNKSAVYLMSWAGYLGVIAVAGKAAHLRPQFADKLWAGKPHLFVIVQNLVMLLFNIFLFVAAVSYIAESYEFGDTNVVLKIKLWIIQLIIPYCFLSMGLRNIYFIFYPAEQLELKQEYES